MADAGSIRARLGLDTSDWRGAAKTTEADVNRLKGAFTESAASVAKFQSVLRAAGGGTAEQKKQLQELSREHTKLQQELRRSEKELDKYNAQVAAQVKASAGTGPVRVVRPPVGQPRTLPPRRPGSSSDPKPEEPEDDKPSNRMRNMELGHVARSAFDSLAAGQSPLRIVEQEAPRVLQAFGSSLVGVMKFLGPLGITGAAAAAGLGAVLTVLEHAHAAAVKLTGQIDQQGRPQASLGGDTREAARSRLEALTAPIAELQGQSDSPTSTVSAISETITRSGLYRGFQKGRAGIYNGLYGVLGLRNTLDANGNIPDRGTTPQEALEQTQNQQAGAYNRLVNVSQRDNKLSARSASEGADAVASNRLEEEFKQKKDDVERLVAANPKIGDTDLVKALREEYDLRKEIAKVQHEQIEASYELARTQSAIRLGNDPRTTTVVDPLDLQSKAISASRAKLDAADKELARVQNAGLDDRQAQERADEATASHHETLFSARAELTAAQEQTKEMQLQITGQDRLAEQERIRADYEARIKASQEAGTTELTNQLKIQSSLAQLSNRAANNPALHPGQAEAERQRQVEQTNAARRELSFEKTQEGNRLANVEHLGPTEVKKRLDEKFGALEKQLGGTGATESPENASDDAFNRRFHKDGGNEVPDVAPLGSAPDYQAPVPPSIPTPSIDSDQSGASAYNGPSAEDIGAAVADKMQIYVTYSGNA